MDAKPSSREQTLTGLFYYAVIAVSAALVLWPALRVPPFPKVAVDVMTFGMLAIVLRREWRRKTLGMTIAQIYAQARAGRKFAPPAIELAAMVMWIWATWVVG